VALKRFISRDYRSLDVYDTARGAARIVDTRGHEERPHVADSRSAFDSLAAVDINVSRNCLFLSPPST